MTLPVLVRTSAVAAVTILLSTATLLTSAANADTAVPSNDAPLVISEVQTGGCLIEGQVGCTGDAKDAKKEFVELYNQQSEPLIIRGWQLQYFSNDGIPVELATMNGTVNGHGSVVISYGGYFTEAAQMNFTNPSNLGALAESNGHLQIVDIDGNIVDRVGWGSAARPFTKAAKTASAGRSIQRLAATNEALVNTGNNSTDFIVSDVPAPKGGGYIADPPAEPTPNPVPTPSPAPPALTCEGVVISEILPNPAGTDSGHEYVELHNPTNEVISLEGCSLQTGTTSKSTYTLTAVSLQPGEYRSFSDTETSMTLANSAGGTVWLLTATDELQAITYPANLADDVAWSLTDGSWAQTYTPTPGAANTLTTSLPCPAGQERNSETNRCQNIETVVATAASSLVPCKAGQERSPETNRCRNVTSADNELTPCKAGQTRNPATNRCAAGATSASASATTTCKAGQERNPETNRCRAVASATTTAKSCPAGQERNPETNRCRKSTASSGSIAKVEDVKTPPSANHGRWLLIGVAIFIAIGYAIYEWRQEISQKLGRLFKKTSVQPAKTYPARSAAA